MKDLKELDYRAECIFFAKELKALKIIKALKPFFFYISIGGKHYLQTIIDDVAITKEEYELLKEVLL